MDTRVQTYFFDGYARVHGQELSHGQIWMLNPGCCRQAAPGRSTKQRSAYTPAKFEAGLSVKQFHISHAVFAPLRVPFWDVSILSSRVPISVIPR